MKNKTLRDLKPAEARKAVMAFLAFLRSEGADVANFGALVLDESDGYNWGVTFGQALDVISTAKTESIRSAAVRS